ncbi:MAG: LbtU family siderophore porin [Gammaproteobacteria bacterium]|nr:LbtU family siderophore porin [Gammaproteobacteria bacterium]
MKLKPIVASMLVLVSGPVLAATASDNANTQAQLDAMKANVAKLQAIVEQNQPGGFQQPDNWWNRISLSGQVLFDAIQSSRQGNIQSPTTNQRLASDLSEFAGYQSSTFAVDSANLFVDANASDYTRAHLDLAYQTGTNQTHYYQVQQPTLNEGYVILGNFNKYPFYLMAGRQNVQFGEYDVYPMVYSFTQLMTQTKATAATAGFVDACSGFNAAVYGFKGLHQFAASGLSNERVNAFGAKVGIKNNFDNWGYGVSVDYLSNMVNVDYIKTSNATNTALDNGLSSTGYRNHVAGVAVDGDLVGGPFDAKVRWVQSLGHFNQTDVPDYSNSVLQTNGAKPWAAGLDLGYSFLTMQHQSRVGVGYQQSGQAAGVGAFGLAQNRYEAQYVVNVSRYTDLGLDVYYDNDYSTSNGGSGLGATTGVLRLGVKFA